MTKPKVIKWSKEKAEEVQAWRVENVATLAQCAEKFGSSGSAIGQGLAKYGFKAPDGLKYTRKAGDSKKAKMPVPKIKSFDLEVPEQTVERNVVVMVVPLSQVNHVVSRLWQS